jgi:hypothetical protein
MNHQIYEPNNIDMKTEQHENISTDRNFNTDTRLSADDQILQTKYVDDLTTLSLKFEYYNCRISHRDKYGGG